MIIIEKVMAIVVACNDLINRGHPLELNLAKELLRSHPNAKTLQALNKPQHRLASQYFLRRKGSTLPLRMANYIMQVIWRLWDWTNSRDKQVGLFVSLFPSFISANKIQMNEYSMISGNYLQSEWWTSSVDYSVQE